jgi:IS605 OrfB family transposase
VVITRKIELLFQERSKARQTELWDYLRRLNYDVFLAANHIVNHQFFNSIYNQRQIYTEFRKVDIQIKEIKKKLKVTYNTDEQAILNEQLISLKEQRKIKTHTQEEEFRKIFGTDEQNSTYAIVRELFPEIPSTVVSALNYNVVKHFKKYLFKVKTGEQSLTTYRQGIPIPFQKVNLRFSRKGEDTFVLKWLQDVRFRVNFGRDRSHNQVIVQQIMDGVYDTGMSSLQLKEDKIFLLLSVDIPNKEPKGLDPNLAVGVDLGINTPAYCALSNEKSFLQLGNKRDFFDHRIQMQYRRKRLFKSLKLTQGGKGKTKKMKLLDKLEGLEKNYVRTYNHNISKQIILFALKHGAGTIKLESLTNIGKEYKNTSLLRNWSYHELQTLIKYKAEREGIGIVFVNPHRTSSVCARCNHYEPKQRIVQLIFRCKNPDCPNYMKDVSADRNAAINIAKSVEIVYKTL